MQSAMMTWKVPMLELLPEVMLSSPLITPLYVKKPNATIERSPKITRSTRNLGVM